MRKSRFTEEQIISMIKEQAAGLARAEVCRKHGVSSARFYKYKAKYGGLDVSDARKLKGLEAENAKLKRLLADTMLDNVALKDAQERANAAALTRGSGEAGDERSWSLAAPRCAFGWCRSQDAATGTSA